MRIRGRVQAVGFRYEARARARSLGVAGWIRNESDGSVLAEFEGPEEQVKSMLEWCRHGPRGARVDAVEVESEPPQGGTDFAVS